MRFDKVSQNQFGNGYFRIVKIDTPQYGLGIPDDNRKTHQNVDYTLSNVYAPISVR